MRVAREQDCRLDTAAPYGVRNLADPADRRSGEIGSTRVSSACRKRSKEGPTEWAPWYVIPADRKWFARFRAAAVLVHALMEIDPRFPVTPQQHRALLEVKERLEEKAPKGAPADPFEQERQDATEGTWAYAATATGVTVRRRRRAQPAGRERQRSGGGENGDGRATRNRLGSPHVFGGLIDR